MGRSQACGSGTPAPSTSGSSVRESEIKVGRAELETLIEANRGLQELVEEQQRMVVRTQSQCRASQARVEILMRCREEDEKKAVAERDNWGKKVERLTQRCQQLGLQLSVVSAQRSALQAQNDIESSRRGFYESAPSHSRAEAYREDHSNYSSPTRR